MSITSEAKKNHLPLSLFILIVLGGSVFYFYNVLQENKIADENLKIERIINEFSYAHIYYLKAVKEKRGYQINKSNGYADKYKASKNVVYNYFLSLDTLFANQKEKELLQQYKNSITQRFSHMDEHVAVIDFLSIKKDSVKISTEDLALWESGNEEEQLYTKIISSLKRQAGNLYIAQQKISRYNYAGFIFLVLMTVFLVLLNMRQVKKLAEEKINREREQQILKIVKESEQEFSAAFEYASIGMALIGLNGEWLKVNKSLCDMLGYSTAELMLCTFQDITHEDDLETDLAYLKQLVNGEIQTYQMVKRYYTKTGEIIWINLSVSKILNPDGGIKHFISQIENINARKFAEIDLQNEKERLANVLDGTNAGTWELNMKTGETVYNERWAAIAGYTLDELKPINLNTWRSLVHPYDLISSDAKLQACFEKNEVYYDCECRLKHKDGHWVWVLDRGKVISRTEDGLPLLMSGTQIDITAIKNAEQAIKEKQALVESVLNSIDVGIVVCDAKGGLTLFNEATKNMHGLPVTGIPADKWAAYYDLYKADAVTLLAQDDIPLYQVLKNGYVTTEQIYIKPKNGNKRLVRCSGSKIVDEKGNVYGAVVAMQDITEQNKFENLLAFNEKRFRGIFNATHQLIGFLDLDGNVMEANDTALKFGGLKPEDVVGKKFWECFWWSHSKQEQKNVKAAFDDAVAGSFKQYETTHVNADGKFVAIIFNLKPLFDDDGKVIAVISEGRPIQDMANARKRLLQKNDELQQFAWLASHDLKEPLRMVRNFMQLLKKNHAHLLDEKANKYIDFAVDGAGRMSNFINDLLAYSNTGSDEIPKEQVDTQLLVDEIVAMQQAVLKEKNTVITYTNLPTITAHKTPLTLVFQNLINNAVKYQQRGSEPHITITAKETNNYWEFAVADNGIGIEEPYFIKIFDLFKRLHVSGEYSGTGMGLATAKKIVQQHGGNIWVTSQLGKGSIFYFTFAR